MQGTGSRNKIIAGFVTIAGVVAIWAFGAARQNDQTRALSRQYIGEQWDVARNCLLGTPIGRGQDVEAIRELLDRQLVDAMARAVTEPDRDRLWPARCAPLFSQLRADPSILESDPGDSIATLEVLAPRVLDGTPLVTRRARERAHELAEAIALLDAAMPSGAEYERPESDDVGMPAGAVLGSLECAPVRPVRRPFLDATSGEDTLFDELALGERSLRVTGTSDGAFTLSVSSPSGTETTALSREDGRSPLLFDEDTILWVDDSGLSLRDFGAVSDAAHGEIAGAPPIARAAICRTARGAHLVARRGERLEWIAWPDPSGAPRAAVAIPGSPGSGAFLACGERALIVAWPEDDGWHGASCDGSRCEAMPLLPAGGDLQIAFTDRALAVARGLRTDLSVARVLVREDGALEWTDPVPVARGALTTAGGSFRVEPCNAGAFVSEDGRRWHPAE